MEAQHLNWIQTGSRIRVVHPTQGELTVYVSGKVTYQELWQQVRGPQSPWVPTGNTFLGFWLETNRYLLNWQNRFYLLDDREPLSDADIQRNFLPHARKFGQSDQTADVYFEYPPAMWHMDDIGKFRIASVDGQTPPLQIGSVGRFIHASGDSARALAVEDYEGGGQDVAWIGYTIAEKDIQKA